MSWPLLFDFWPSKAIFFAIFDSSVAIIAHLTWSLCKQHPLYSLTGKTTVKDGICGIPSIIDNGVIHGAWTEWLYRRTPLTSVRAGCGLLRPRRTTYSSPYLLVTEIRTAIQFTVPCSHKDGLLRFTVHESAVVCKLGVAAWSAHACASNFKFERPFSYSYLNSPCCRWSVKSSRQMWSIYELFRHIEKDGDADGSSVSARDESWRVSQNPCTWCIIIIIIESVDSISRNVIYRCLSWLLVSIMLYACAWERERERERGRVEFAFVWRWACRCGSCAFWTLRPLLAACQDVSSFVRYPAMTMCVSERERERGRVRIRAMLSL